MPGFMGLGFWGIDFLGVPRGSEVLRGTAAATSAATAILSVWGPLAGSAGSTSAASATLGARANPDRVDHLHQRGIGDARIVLSTQRHGDQEFGGHGQPEHLRCAERGRWSVSTAGPAIERRRPLTGSGGVSAATATLLTAPIIGRTTANAVSWATATLCVPTSSGGTRFGGSRPPSQTRP